MLTRLLFYVINWESNCSLLSVAVIDNYNQKQLAEEMVGFSFLLHVAVYHREVRMGAKAGAGMEPWKRSSLACSAWLLLSQLL